MKISRMIFRVTLPEGGQTEGADKIAVDAIMVRLRWNRGCTIHDGSASLGDLRDWVS